MQLELLARREVGLARPESLLRSEQRRIPTRCPLRPAIEFVTVRNQTVRTLR
jgi:hypothetical protein